MNSSRESGRQCFRLGETNFLKRYSVGWKTQKLVTFDGFQKGLKTLLEERGVNTSGLKKEDMIKLVEKMRNFKFQKTKVKE